MPAADAESLHRGGDREAGSPDEGCESQQRRDAAAQSGASHGGRPELPVQQKLGHRVSAAGHHVGGRCTV